MIHLRRHRPAAATPAVLLLALTMGACAEAEPAPGAHVGTIPIPAPHLAGLGEFERAALADLVALGAVIAAGSADSLVAPIVALEVTASRVAGLPYHLAAARIGLDDAELRQAYAASPEWALTVRHLVRLAGPEAPEARRDSARAIAASLAERAAAGADFASLAATYSEEPGAAARGGLLEPGREGSWVQPFWDAAVRLEPGETSGVVETIYGFHVLHLDARRPVPFDSASRTRLLQRVLPLSTATEAMEGWAVASGAVLVDGPSVEAARASLASGSPPSDTLGLAVGAAGGRFTGNDLVAAWARLGPDARAGLEAADASGFAAWVEDEARGVIWGGIAASMGVEPAADAGAAASALWTQRLALWGQLFGFRAGMTQADLLAAAVQATLSGAPEARGARNELRSLRPRLRQLHPFRVAVSVPEGR